MTGDNEAVAVARASADYVRRRLEAAEALAHAAEALAAKWDAWAWSEFGGTHLLDKRLAEADPLRAAVAAYREAGK